MVTQLRGERVTALDARPGSTVLTTAECPVASTRNRRTRPEVRHHLNGVAPHRGVLRSASMRTTLRIQLHTQRNARSGERRP